MHASYPALGKRELNKLDKLERIIDVATELFSKHGIDNVKITQIAEQAHIGKGTLFLYARNKGELVLLVQNAHYKAAIERGAQQAALESEPRAAVAAIVREVVSCNRIHVDNGRNYLRELLFGSTEDPHRKRALEIVASADQAIATALGGASADEDESGIARAEVISYVMFMTMALSENAGLATDEIIAEILRKVALVIPHR